MSTIRYPSCSNWVWYLFMATFCLSVILFFFINFSILDHNSDQYTFVVSILIVLVFCSLILTFAAYVFRMQNRKISINSRAQNLAQEVELNEEISHESK